MITTQFRDQPAYKYLMNHRLTNKLRRYGVQVYEWANTSQVLHVKGYIIDNKAQTGSFNNDWWSWSINNELNLYVRDPENFAEIL
jgi:phosphatidylserine/phosphatidylglycerophosphate/cardiolipin synthase-like enzyme